MIEEGTTPAETQEDVVVFAIVTTVDGTVAVEGIKNVMIDGGPGIKVLRGVAAHIWPVDYMRNEVVRQALERDDWDYLWFIDDDIIPPLGTIQRLVEAGKDIIAAPYHALQWASEGVPRLSWAVTQRNDDGSPKKVSLGEELTQVHGCGMGCTLIHRPVFESIKSPWFEYKTDYTTIPYERQGEDFDFCNKARDAGFEVWCDPSVVCGHSKLIDLKVVATLVSLQLKAQSDSYEERIVELEAKVNA